MTKKEILKEDTTSLVPQEIIANKILLIRGKKVMLDSDLAELYGVETAQLKRQVRRNIDRFPDDFMFQLIKEEEDEVLRCQIGISKKEGRGGRRYMPLVFTEQGVAMLSTVLNSKRAIMINIQIMRIFSKLREMLLSHIELQKKIEDLERTVGEKLEDHDGKLKMVLEALKQLLQPPEEPQEQIGFKIGKGK